MLLELFEWEGEVEIPAGERVRSITEGGLATESESDRFTRTGNRTESRLPELAVGVGDSGIPLPLLLRDESARKAAAFARVCSGESEPDSLSDWLDAPSWSLDPTLLLSPEKGSTGESILGVFGVSLSLPLRGENAAKWVGVDSPSELSLSMGEEGLCNDLECPDGPGILAEAG